MLLNLSFLLSRYLEIFPSEVASKASFAKFLEQAPVNWFDRKNSAGHVTASGIVIDQPRNRLLTVHHIALGRWLQPGGHVESEDMNLQSAALREVVEETGVDPSDLTLISLDADPAIPLDIDTHEIGARSDKAEGVHFHFDCRYLFTYRGNAALRADLEETHAAQWQSIEKIETTTTFERMICKAKWLLDGQRN